ncbi:hypothetical protein [Agrobacterium tumefaciens]
MREYPYAERQAQADLPLALNDTHQHDIHDADAPGNQRYRADS